MLPLLLPFFFLAVDAYDHPNSFPITSTFPRLGSAIPLVKSERARVQRLINNAMHGHGRELDARAAPGSVEATNVVTGYTMTLGIGSPPTNYDVLIDTGSSNTWVGNLKPYVITNTSVDTHNNVSVTYGSGAFSGKEYLDLVTLSPELIIHNQSIGASEQSIGFPADGLIGLGPFGLTIGTLSPEVALGIKTITQNLANQSRIPATVLGVSFEPTTNASTKNGRLTFGGVDASSEVTYVGVPKEGAASHFWGLEMGIRYGKTKNKTTSVLPNASQGFLDTGATLILLDTASWTIYKNTTGAELDSLVGLLSLSPDKAQNLGSLWFDVNGTTFELTPNAQMWPRSLNTFIGGEANSTYLVVSDLGSVSGAPELNFVAGYTFLERFYTVYDTDHNRVGIANTNFTYATIM